MSANEVWVVKIILGMGSAMFAILAAVFACIEARRDENFESDRMMFHTIWKNIHSSRWITLPENVISWLLETERRLSKLPQYLIDKEWFIQKVIFIILPITLLIACWCYWSIWIGLLFFIISFPLSALFISGKADDVINLGDFSESCMMIYVGICFTFCGVIVILLSLSVAVHFAVLLMLILLPIIWFIFLGPVFVLFLIVERSKKFKNKNIDVFLESNLPPVAMALAISFTITYLAFLLGSIGKPDAPLPKTFQMLVSNVIFDGATMLVTLLILKWAISKSFFLRLPFTITVDILIAGILACFSLYFGLVFTKNALTLKEVVNVLIARSPNGSEFELSPYFWAMHTSFLPTLFYLSLILLCWTGKVILQPIVWFFGLGRTLKNPLKLTITVMTLFSVLLGALSYGAGAIEGRLKEKSSSLNNTMNLTESGTIEVTKQHECYHKTDSFGYNVSWQR